MGFCGSGEFDSGELSAMSGSHVNKLYARLRTRKGHSKAVGAVARHLAEAAFHVLSRQPGYRDPTTKVGRTNGGVNATLS
jgi:hypothetical protein